MPPSNPVISNVKSFSSDWKKIAKKLSILIKQKIRRGISYKNAVKQAFAELNVENLSKKNIVDQLASAVEKGGIVLNVDIGFKKWYLEQHFTKGELSLSKKIVSKGASDIIANTLEDQLKKNKSFTETATAMTDTDLVKGTIAGHISKLETLSMRVSSGDMKAFNDYRKQLNESRGQIERLAQAGAPTERLKAAYQKVIDASEKLNDTALAAAINDATKAKAQNNSERIARTEIARAYGVGVQTKAKQDSDVIGLKWVLSSRHMNFDICDMNAKANHFRMGKGVYPKAKVPKYPAHPNCLCVLEEIFKGEAPTESYDKDASVKLLKTLPAKDQTAILGKEGRERFIKEPNSASKALPTYKTGSPLPTPPAKLVK